MINIRLDGNGHVITLPRYDNDPYNDLITLDNWYDVPIYFLNGPPFGGGYAWYPFKEQRDRLKKGLPLFDDPDYIKKIKQYFINRWQQVKATIYEELTRNNE